MPTYVYECRSCGKVFEVEQRITENALSDCECGATSSLRRLIQPVAVAFKGAGFHINDYAPKPGGSDGAPETGASEAKPAETASEPTKPKTEESAPSAVAPPSAANPD